MEAVIEACTGKATPLESHQPVIGEAGAGTSASLVRRAPAEDNRRVNAHLAGRRRQEIAVISDVHALLTNIVLAWNANPMDGVVARLERGGAGIEEDWHRRIGPAQLSHIDFRGTIRFNFERYADVTVDLAVGQGAAKPGQ
jgi:hypothetical protein